MERKFIAAVAALIFWAAAPVNAGNIIKFGKDINIGKRAESGQCHCRFNSSK